MGFVGPWNPRLSYCTAYEQREHLINFKSPEIRSTFTKLRTDANYTLSSLLRRFRKDKMTISICTCGDGEQEVEHVIFICKNKEMILIHENFKRDIVDML